MRTKSLRFVIRIAVLATIVLSNLGGAARAVEDAATLATRLAPWLEVVSGKVDAFELSGRVDARIDGEMQGVDLRIARYDRDSFDFAATHRDYAVAVRRRVDSTALALPKHGRVYVGRGDVPESLSLAPLGLTARMTSDDSLVKTYLGMVQESSPALLAATLTGLLKAEHDPSRDAWRLGDVAISFPAPERIVVETPDATVTLERVAQVAAPPAIDDWAGLESESIDRAELERTLVRGVRRAGEILAPGPTLTRPAQEARRTANGELRWVEGQRVVLLSGTPEEIGTAHGELMRVEAGRCIDSVMHTFATVETIRGGVWFRHRLDDAYARLKPHIPERHLRETRALATALGESTDLIEAVNVFPELFHCSGFALFGSATVGGKLYHGRVLDYMTTIGLQDACATLIVASEGQIPFANVGYAGFIGSVSGMNAEAISVGEMGGRGEGLWDGAPMATLMRRALEECDSLDEVKRLWSESPRTCEYYYVFADGRRRQAVGVAATPDSIEFIGPGEGHERLGSGIPDAVVLSAGNRLETLRARVLAAHGSIDEVAARELMSRPVAMSSNLHNVLFVPEDGILWVANADHKQPAADRPYVRIDLGALLDEIRGERSAAISTEE